MGVVLIMTNLSYMEDIDKRFSGLIGSGKILVLNIYDV